MITLITGAPGSGKTALVVSELLPIKSRPVYVDGIPELKLDVFTSGDVLKWHDWLPDGSLLVIDEAQRYFRPRANGSSVPAAVQALETHRHRGADIWFVTQAPHLLDANIRRLVGRHIHIRQSVIGRYKYEWTECGDIEAKSSRDNAIKSRFQPPKKSFQFYKSAEIHTKQARAFSKLPFILVFSLLLVVGIGYKIFNSVSERISPVEKLSSPVVEKKSDFVLTSNNNSSPAVVNLHPAAFVPPASYPEYTAPAYSGLIKVADVPIVSACIKNVSKCVCYSQQGTRMNVDLYQCHHFALNATFQPFEVGFRNSEVH